MLRPLSYQCISPLDYHYLTLSQTYMYVNIRQCLPEPLVLPNYMYRYVNIKLCKRLINMLSRPEPSGSSIYLIVILCLSKSSISSIFYAYMSPLSHQYISLLFHAYLSLLSHWSQLFDDGGQRVLFIGYGSCKSLDHVGDVLQGLPFPLVQFALDCGHLL